MLLLIYSLNKSDEYIGFGYLKKLNSLYLFLTLIK